jgi:hypothetical protein
MGQAVLFIVIGISIAVLFFLIGLTNRVCLRCGREKEPQNEDIRTMTRDVQAATTEMDDRYREAGEQEASDGEASDGEASDGKARGREPRGREASDGEARGRGREARYGADGYMV